MQNEYDVEVHQDTQTQPAKKKWEMPAVVKIDTQQAENDIFVFPDALIGS